MVGKPEVSGRWLAAISNGKSAYRKLIGYRVPAFCFLAARVSILRTPRTTRRWIFRLTTTKN
jgi:hypothetical protein